VQHIAATCSPQRDAPPGAPRSQRDAQLDAIHAWGTPDPSNLNRLAGVTQPVLVANGDTDRMVPTRNSHVLADRLPDARLRIWQDAGHGFLFQYSAEVEAFLSPTNTSDGASKESLT